MAKKETTTEETKAAEVTTTKKAVSVESEYTAEELANNAKKLFDARSECVAAALKSANVTRCSISKAKEIVSKFMTKEVK